VAEDSPSCLPWLRLALFSNLVALFIGCVVFVFSFFGKFLFLPLLLLFVRPRSAAGRPFLP
jgi:hypothetical protein